MKKLLSLALTLAMLAGSIISVSAAENTSSGGGGSAGTSSSGMTVVNYIDNWDFDDAESSPKTAFLTLPDLVTEDGVTAAKFDAYTKETNVGFQSSSWENVSDKYMVFDLRIKADKKTEKTMRILDGNQIKYDGTSVTVPGFEKITLAANVWNKITLVMDMSAKELTYNDNDTVKKVSNIKPTALVVNGKRYIPTKTDVISVESRRNYIEPYKVNNVFTQDGIVYMDYYKTYTTTEAAVTELITDRETYLVSKYIDNLDFSEGNRPTEAWQGLVTFENDEAIFNTEVKTVDGKTYQNPGFHASHISNYIDGKNKFLVLEFAVKSDAKLKNYLRIWNSNDFSFNGESLKVPGFGNVALEAKTYHNVVYVVNIENATADANNSITGMKPYLMYIDGEKYKPSNNNDISFGNAHNRMWINSTDKNNTATTADIVYMDYYKTYIADSKEVEDDATYLKTTTKYTPVNMIVNRDFDYKGDLSTGAQGILPVMTTENGKGVVYFNSNNAKEADNSYSNIGFYDDIKFADMKEDYVVLETGLKFGNTDAKNICLFGAMVRVVGNGDEAILRLQSDTGAYNTGIDRNVWYDVSLVLDRSTFEEDGNLKAVKLAVGDSEINLEQNNIVWTSANKNRNANTVYIENNKDNIEFWLDYYKAYTIEKEAYAFAGTSKYTMQDLIYDYEFDVKAGNKFHDGKREAVTLSDGTKAVKLTAYTGTKGANGGFEIYAGDGTGTVAIETKVMIPENDGASSYCLANIIDLKAKTASEENGEDTLAVSLYDGESNIVEDLAFGEWHTFEVVVDNDNKKYLTITIDGTKYDIANGFRSTASGSNTTRYYVEGKTDAELTETKSHIMYMDYMKSYKINDYISAPKYTDKNGETATALALGEILNISVDVNAEIKSAPEAVAAVLYSGNKLVSVTKGTYNSENGKITAQISVPSEITNPEVKVLFWDGINAIKPVAAADTFPKK